MTITDIPVQQIKTGDIYLSPKGAIGWQAIGSARTGRQAHETLVPVEYPDGSQAWRIFPADTSITIWR